ncbi:MAG: cytochrome c oxidase cbb3-type subunit 2 [Candidatus Azotimanducaceae bacterium]|jgi:cytochrome c oxidase cbb3-type subunit 2
MNTAVSWLVIVGGLGSLIVFFLLFHLDDFGGFIEIVPLMTQKVVMEPIKGLKPLEPLALEGRDIYISSGCHVCHSQMIRPLRSELERYDPYSVVDDLVYNHPFLFGSKRTGPDLARVGGIYSDEWRRAHLYDPRLAVPESNQPALPWLFENEVDLETLPKKLAALQALGVPYTNEQIENATKGLKDKTEADALIAYLQQLGPILQERR